MQETQKCFAIHAAKCISKILWPMQGHGHFLSQSCYIQIMYTYPIGFIQLICPHLQILAFNVSTRCIFKSSSMKIWVYMGGFLKCWVSPTNPWDFPTTNDHDLGCEIGGYIPPFKGNTQIWLEHFGVISSSPYIIPHVVCQCLHSYVYMRIIHMQNVLCFSGVGLEVPEEDGAREYSAVQNSEIYLEDGIPWLVTWLIPMVIVFVP